MFDRKHNQELQLTCSILVRAWRPGCLHCCVCVFALFAVLIALTLATDAAGAVVEERQAGAGREGVGHAGGREHRDLRNAV
jgi:hypothetical protein